MFLSFGSIFLFCACAAIVWFWHDSLRARDFANAAAMAACERMGLQFLDGTAAFARLRFARDRGRLQLRRTYVFDYTSQSIERRQGFAMLIGMHVEYVGFAPEHNAQPRAISLNAEQSVGLLGEPSRSEPVVVVDQAGNKVAGDKLGSVVDLDSRRRQRSEQSGSTPNTDRLH